jgi:mono/diheme cytochrome c family protein
LTFDTKFLNVSVVRTPALLLVASLAAWFSGCSKGNEGSSGSNAAAQAEAAKIFIERCSVCHGPNGAGDGAGAANLNPKPRNLQDRTWQSSVDDAYLEKIIKLGGMGVGKSAAMPPNPDLADNEPVVKALVTKIRSLVR